MVRIGGGSTKYVLSDRWIVYTKSRKQLLHRKYLLYETGCMYLFFISSYVRFLENKRFCPAAAISDVKTCLVLEKRFF